MIIRVHQCSSYITLLGLHPSITGQILIPLISTVAMEHPPCVDDLPIKKNFYAAILN